MPAADIIVTELTLLMTGRAVTVAGTS